MMIQLANGRWWKLTLVTDTGVVRAETWDLVVTGWVTRVMTVMYDWDPWD